MVRWEENADRGWDKAASIGAKIVLRWLIICFPSAKFEWWRRRRMQEKKEKNVDAWSWRHRQTRLYSSCHCNSCSAFFSILNDIHPRASLFLGVHDLETSCLLPCQHELVFTTQVTAAFLCGDIRHPWNRIFSTMIKTYTFWERKFEAKEREASSDGRALA